MATPTRIPVRTPRAATMIIITSRTADNTLFCRSVSMLRIFWSRPRRSHRNRGRPVLRSCSTRALTALTVSTIFSPVRFTSSEIAGSPFSRRRFRGLRTSGEPTRHER